jgi:S-formylglutathione hydrolase
LYIYIGDCKIEGDNDQWDFGEGAGYYIDATESKWSENYQMLILIELEFSGKENI